MMNDEMDNFEARLKRQPPQEIPTHWRAQILAAAQPADAKRANVSRPSTINFRLSTLLRWSPLAAAWLLIVVLHHADRAPAPQPRTMTKSAPITPETRMVLREQRRLLAELTGPAFEAAPADRPKHNPLRPHGQRNQTFSMA